MQLNAPDGKKVRVQNPKFDKLTWEVWRLREKIEFLNEKYESWEQYLKRAYSHKIEMIS